MSDELADLRARVERIEIRDACISAFNEYLHYLDGDYLEDLLGVFAPDAELTVVDYPPGSGENLHFSGHDEIRQLYGPHEAGIGRHHSANVTVNVAPDRRRADLSAYFITSGPFRFGGGLYRVRLGPTDVAWRFQQMAIISTWGWKIDTEAEPYLAKHLGAGAPDGGRPVLYQFPER